MSQNLSCRRMERTKTEKEVYPRIPSGTEGEVTSEFITAQRERAL